MAAPLPGVLQFAELPTSPTAPSVGYGIIYLKTDNVLYIKDSGGVEVALGSSSSITQLTGDVTATGPGVVAATVAFVGGESAADIASATLLALAATALNTASTIVRRNGSGGFSAGAIVSTALTVSSFSTGVVHSDGSGVLSSSLIVNADIDAAAGIVYSKLNLSNSIVNADVNSSAAIDYSKLANLGAATNRILIASASDKVSAHASILSTDLILKDGSVAFTGNVDLGGNAITNVGLVDGVDISSHASRHLPSGADPLAYAIPVQIGTSNFIGAAESFALSDHIHSHGAQTSGTLHAAATTSVNGFMSAADKTKLDNATSAATASTLVLRDSNADSSHRDLTLRNALMTGYVELTEQSAPSTPAANKLDIYTEDRNGFTRIRALDDTGYISTILRDTLFLVKNTTGSTIAKGKAVYVNGSDSTNGVVTIALAKADSSTTVPVFGLTIESIANNAFGRVISTGILSNIDTSAFSDGARVYLSASTAGELTSTKPTSPNIWQRVGVVIKSHASTGSIEVRPLATHGEESGTNTAFTPNVVALTDAATITLDASLGNTFTVTLGGNRTLAAPTNPVNGQKITLRVRQDGTGGRTLTFDSIYRFGLDILSVVPSTGANKTDYIGMIYNSTDTKWDVVAVSKGF